jgi:hypothetical protein
VLRLDDDTKEYLLGLAADKPRRPRRTRRETVPAGTAKLLATLPLPAFVEGRCLDVLAANPLATALSPRLTAGANRMRDVFLDPEEQAMFLDWEVAAAYLIAGVPTPEPRTPTRSRSWAPPRSPPADGPSRT